MSDPAQLRRLHPAAIVLMALRVAREWFLPAILPLALSLYRRGRDAFSLSTMLFILAGLLLFLLISMTVGFVAWRRFTYRVEAGELRIEQGIITRKRRYIPLERIQAIDTSQGVLQRLLGVTSVRIETAGGGGNQPEVSLPGVGRADAEWLRRIIRTGRAAEPVSTSADPVTAPQLIVRRLSVRELLLAAITAGRVGVAFAIVASGLALFDDVLPVEWIVGASERATWHGVVLLLLLGMAVVWLLGVVGTILAHAGFTLTRDGDQLFIERGLLERRRSTVPLNRIQAIRVIERMVHQSLGLVEVRVITAAYGRTAGESTVLFPLLRRTDLLPLLHDMAPQFALDTQLHALPARARMRYVTRFTQVLPVLCIVIAAAILAYPFGLLALLLLPIGLLLGAWQYHDAGWAVVNDTLVLRGRAFARYTALIPQRRIQQAEVSQNPSQKRAQLVHLTLRIASGHDGEQISMLHMDADIGTRVLSWASPE